MVQILDMNEFYQSDALKQGLKDGMTRQPCLPASVAQLASAQEVWLS